MISEAKAFWDSISGKVKSLIRKETENAMRLQRYDVTTAPNGTVMGVRQPFGNNEIFLPYSQEVASATVGDTVLVAWWGSMSNAKVYYFADGYEGATGGGGGDVIASIVFPAAASWTDSGNGYWTATPTISGVTLSAESKIDLQITAAQFITLQSNGVQSLYVENNNVVLTAYAVGNPPTNAITMQCSISGTNAPTPPVNPSLDMIYPIGSIYMNVDNVNPGNTIGGTWERVEDNALYMEKDPLWTNASPTSAFAAQTIPLDLSDYDFVCILYYDSTPATHTTRSFFANVGMNGMLDCTESHITRRSATVNTSGVVFGNGTYMGSYPSATMSVYNDFCIPYKIYGIKGNGRYVWKRTA